MARSLAGHSRTGRGTLLIVLILHLDRTPFSSRSAPGRPPHAELVVVVLIIVILVVIVIFLPVFIVLVAFTVLACTP